MAVGSSPKAVADWLNQLGLAQYVQLFSENAIDFRILPELTDSDLKDLGVLFGHRKLLLKAITKFTPPPIDSPAPEAPKLPEAERRQLTVMFCDLVGSTELSSRLDPEDLRDIMQVYQTTCAEVIERNGGYIAQYLGDGIVIYFGYPQAFEDAAERAVRTGLEIVAAVAQLRHPRATVQVRLGVATGLAVVGDLIGKGAAEQHAVVGQTPNLAARVQSLAAPGSLVIADTTRKLIGENYEVHDMGLQSLKGIDGAVRVWQILGERQDAVRLDASRLTRGACIGREREVEVLLEKWRQAAAGKGQVVFAWGEAGIGKSRLLRLFDDQLNDPLSGESHTPIHLQCSPQHGASPLYPVIRAIHKALAFNETDSVSDKLDKMAAFLSASGCTDAFGGNPDGVPLLASLLCVPYTERYAALTLSPQEQKIATLKLCVEHHIGLAKHQPLLYQVEDAHWIDPTTEELLVRLIDSIGDQRLLLLVTGRPECRPAWLDRPHATALDLGRLGEAEIRAIVHGIAKKTLPEEVMKQILSKTDGIPLFVEELTRTVLESGLLRETGEAWVLDGPLPAMAIPATLQDSLMARLDRLASAKEVVQAAAAIGRHFSYAMLAAVLDQPEAVLRAALGRLAEAELIYLPSVSTGKDYLFKHALVQDAAYESLLKSRRLALHARITRAYETHFAETVESQPELLAHHAALAGLTEQAIQYGLTAGQQAIAKSANKEALGHLRQALELLKTLPEGEARDPTELNLQLALGQAAMVVHGFIAPETASAYERTQELAKRVGQPGQFRSLMTGLYLMHLIGGRLMPATTLADQVLERGKHQADQSLEYLGHRLLGIARFHSGDLAEARMHLRIAKEDPNLFNAVPAFNYLAWVEAVMGYPDTAVKLSDIAVAQSRTTDDAVTMGQSLYHRAVVHFFRQDYEAQLLASAETLAFCEKQCIRHFVVMAGIVNTFAEAAFTGSEAALEKCLGLLVGLEQVAILSTGVFHGCAAKLMREWGQPDRALKELETAFRLSASIEERWYESETERNHGECLLALDPPRTEEAEAAFRRALTKANAMGALTYELGAALSYHTFLAQQDRAAEGIAILKPIYERFTEGFDLPDMLLAKSILKL